MLHQISKSQRATKASLITRMMRRIFLSASALALLVSSASADDNYKLLDWSWKFQKSPMASSFEYCSTNAPRDPADATKPWSKVLETIRAAADKWKYTKKDSSTFQFRFSGDDCPQCPGLNYIEFGTLQDPTKPAETSYPNISGTAKMKKCAIRFNSAMSWNVTDGDPKPTEYDLLSVALHEFGHCVGLGDLQNGTAVMSVGLKPGEKRRDLQKGDTDGRNKIYGDP